MKPGNNDSQTGLPAGTGDWVYTPFYKLTADLA